MLSSVVTALPERELKESEVKALEENDRIDRVSVEITSEGVSSDGSFREGMVEAWWIEIGGTAHVLQYQFQEWRRVGEFNPSDLDTENVHREAFQYIDY